MSFLTKDGDEIVVISDPRQTFVPACGCVRDVGGFLAESFGAKLGLVFLGGGRAAPGLWIRREVAGDPPPFVVPRFCPFCGDRYQGGTPEQRRRPSASSIVAAIVALDEAHDSRDTDPSAASLVAAVRELISEYRP